jgi:hypothetical protein
MRGTGADCEKLDLAAVDATDCAMEGTVTWARRDDGRPALAGAGATTGATGAGVTLDLAGVGETAVGIVTDLAAGLGAGLEAERGGTFTVALGAGLATVLAGGAGTGLAAGFSATLGALLAAGLARAGFATGLAVVFAAGLAALLVAGDVVDLPGFDFTSCLLAELACA